MFIFSTEVDSCYYDSSESSFESADEYLKNRKEEILNEIGTVTVKVGPRIELWTLQQMTEKFSLNDEWGQIKRSVYKVPNVELRSAKDFKPYETLGSLEQKMRQKYTEKITKVLKFNTTFLKYLILIINRGWFLTKQSQRCRRTSSTNLMKRFKPNKLKLKWEELL